MSDPDRRYHEQWLGMVQPIEGLVVSVPVLVDAQCVSRQPIEVQARLTELCPAVDRAPLSGRRRGKKDEAPARRRAIADLSIFLAEILELTPELFDAEPSDELALYVPEGGQTIRPTLALRQPNADGHVLLVWDLPPGLDADKPETQTGPWDYPPAAKFDRLLRHCRVPIGLLTNREVVRLVYAPHGESSGHIDFRVADMARVDGRPILDAFVMLLHARRFFGVAPERTLPALLAESRKRQANVTSDLAEQVFDALAILLRGFEAAAARDGRALLDDAAGRESDHLYKGLLTVLLRLVFLLYAEDRGLMPVDQTLYSSHLGVLGLFERLQADAGAYPDSMPRRFGAWGQLLALFRAVYLGAEHAGLAMPPRRGALFDPNRFPFLEGWGPDGGAPVVMAEHRAAVKVPTVDDETVYRVLEKLVVFEGQRLSYRTLDVEQIGSVYEALMGYHVVPVDGPAVCMKPDGHWLTAAELLEVAPAQRARFLKDTVGLTKAHATKLAAAVKAAEPDAAFAALADYCVTGKKRDRSLAMARAGQLVIQPGAERRRTSSHYTPRSLSAPIVRRTLEPLLAAMGDRPRSDELLELKICDPAMGSGAFLVEACRFLGDQLVAAWTREGKLAEVARVAPGEDPVLHARRLVAQRCLYGVDKNDAAVELAKLSLWLVTLARDLPFTFLDHALRHGDSLVGLDFEQIRSFHWKPSKQLELSQLVLDEALDEAINIRQRILELAGDPSPEAQREKELLAADAEDASSRARLVADAIVGAFFAEQKDKAREKERKRRLDLVQTWLGGSDEARAQAEAELKQLQAQLRARIPVFHWMLEFPEVFHAERPDPLDKARVNRAAYMDGFVGNPPFLGGKRISTEHGDGYAAWLQSLHETTKNADLSAQFLRRAAGLLGDHGTMGFIATNTIGQGDTRAAALQPLLALGFRIYDARTSLPWIGGPNVAVVVVHLAVGNPSDVAGQVRLDGRPVTTISSQLRHRGERAEPVRLLSNAGCSYVGSYVLGGGFTLTPEERDALVVRSPCNAERVFPYIGGEEVNTSPTQSPERYVINFGEMTLEEAERWPDLMRIVREQVKPHRDRVKREAHKRYWWHYADKRPALYRAIQTLDRCLVTSIHSKHLVFSFQPTGRVWSHGLIVMALSGLTAFAVLQSRIHEVWARLFSSTLEDRAATSRIRYTASDCFETFPFSQPDPRTVVPDLEDIGKRLYEARATYMLETQQGLTQTYNHLKDPTNTDPQIATLRQLHEDLDQAVLAAYGWTDIQVPPYCPPNPDDEAALQAFRDEVIDKLFVLNAERRDGEMKRNERVATGKPTPSTTQRGDRTQGAQ